MDRRFDASGLLVGASALVLVVSLFLHWYGVHGLVHLTGWRAFEVLDLVLLGAAGAALAAAVGRLPSRVALAAAGVVLVVVVSQLVEPPPTAPGTQREEGAWLALAAALGLAAGAALMAAQIAVTVDVRGRERRPRIPAVDRRDGEAGGRGPRSAEDTGPPAATPAARVDPFAPPARASGSVAAEVDPEPTQPHRIEPEPPASA